MSWSIFMDGIKNWNEPFKIHSELKKKPITMGSLYKKFLLILKYDIEREGSRYQASDRRDYLWPKEAKERKKESERGEEGDEIV